MDEDKREEQNGQRLNRYLKELIEKQDQILLTEKDILELNDKFPLNHEEKGKILLLAQRHIHRAEQYKLQERWDSAIVETERALLFSPMDIDLRLNLSELYILRSRQYGYLEKDLYRADQKIKESLILEPKNIKAKKMEKEFQSLNRMLKGTDQNKKIIPLVIIIVLIMGAVLYPRIRDFYLWNRAEEAPLDISLMEDPVEWTEKELQVLKTDSLEEKITLDITRAVLSKNDEAYTVYIFI
ncbi:MAG: hypothetical protein B6241_06555 [Spirochaetaceae bacterium 4572_59]|nr:MAG: hypothetical protein B6241_06555 [Spirochaetaceae bacterium 4572_59]